MSTQGHLTTMILWQPRRRAPLKEALLKAEIDFTAIVFGDGESAFRYIDGEAGPRASRTRHRSLRSQLRKNGKIG